MSYREFPVGDELAPLVVCTWERGVPVEDAPPSARILPDGCVDLVWGGSELIVAGPDTSAFESALTAGQTVVGLRLRPGVAGSALGIPMKELRDTRVSLDLLWGRNGAEIEERLGLSATAGGRRRLLERVLTAHLPDADAPDRLVIAAGRVLGLPGARVSALSDVLGTSERQLLRRFDHAVGYGPKALDRVLRFQRFLARAPSVAGGEEGLARLGTELGYADQAHLTRECRRLSGMTPAVLAARWAA